MIGGFQSITYWYKGILVNYHSMKEILINVFELIFCVYTKYRYKIPQVRTRFWNIYALQGI